MAATKRGMKGWTVSIETWGDGIDSVDDELLMDLAPTIATYGGSGAAAAAGGLAGGPSATFSVMMSSAEVDGPARALGEVTRMAVSIFDTACEKLGIEHEGIAKVDVMQEMYADRELAREAESYLGVSELAAELGVSRQRVSELRTRADFPAPVAELAAGPVWAASALRRFVATWERKPGRPLTVRNPTAERLRAKRLDRIANPP